MTIVIIKKKKRKRSSNNKNNLDLIYDYPEPPESYSPEACATCAQIARDLRHYSDEDVVKAGREGVGDKELLQILRWASYSIAEDWVQDYVDYRHRK